MKKIHMIGNAHLDPVWLWDWREGFQENKATFYSALNRMEEFDDFIFTSSSAQFYQWIEENEPELFEKIRQRIQEGRWVICGGWWVQPDCNIPGGESFARHSLLGQTYFQEKFGVTAKTGYCVDSFGHNGMLPQILRKSGMENYVFMRPGPHEKDLPARAFLWESPDGSRVKAFRLPYSYGLWEGLEENIDKMLLEEFSPGVDHMMCFYGVGNHGGGPTVENLKNIRTLREKREDLEIAFSSPDQYFAEIADCALPVVRDDLQHHAAGCYAAETMVKTMNRRAEAALCTAEIFAEAARAKGLKDYSGRLGEAWEQVLFNQFHDTLAGSSIEKAYYDARNQLGEAVAVASRCENNALQAIAFRIHIPQNPDTLPVVVFNPHSWQVTAPVELENGMFRNGLSLEELVVEDCDGRILPHQQIDPACRVPGRKRITFIATVPPLGYALFTLKKGEKQATVLEPDTFCMENEFLRVCFDRETGNVASVWDKEQNREILAGPASAVVIEDDTDTWGHTLKKLKRQAGEFRLTFAKVLDSGPVRTCLRVTAVFGKSTLVQTYSLYAEARQLAVQASVNWQEHSRALKLYFPVAAQGGEAGCEIPFGWMKKEQNGFEEPMQRWADISGENCGLSILNDNKYSVDFENDTIGLTVLRSPVYAQHDPYVLREDEEYDYMDQGISRFGYTLLPHGGDWRKAGTVREAALLNQPMTTMFETFHPGPFPMRDSFLQVDKENIILSALKKAHRSGAHILRLYESWGERTQARVELFGTGFTAVFSPWEIKTFSVEDGAVREVNFLE